MTYNPVELILKKREGHELSASEIDFFIQNFVKGEIPDYQMSAMLMCIFFKGASSEEISALTGSYITKAARAYSFPRIFPWQINTQPAEWETSFLSCCPDLCGLRSICSNDLRTRLGAHRRHP